MKYLRRTLCLSLLLLLVSGCGETSPGPSVEADTVTSDGVSSDVTDDTLEDTGSSDDARVSIYMMTHAQGRGRVMNTASDAQGRRASLRIDLNR